MCFFLVGVEVSSSVPPLRREGEGEEEGVKRERNKVRSREGRREERISFDELSHDMMHMV